MRKHVLVFTTTAVILACGVIAATAQSPGAQAPGTQQSPTIQPTPGGSATQSKDQVIRDVSPLQDEDDQDDFSRMMGPGMMGPGMMGRGTMGRGMIGRVWHHDRDRGGNAAGLMMMRIIFSLMDADGDGKLTLQEFQAAHERIFKAMDANKDGIVTLEEMQNFMRGTSGPASQQ
jgi:hypothetical protein